jgi:hypothetical protein
LVGLKLLEAVLARRNRQDRRPKVAGTHYVSRRVSNYNDPIRGQRFAQVLAHPLSSDGGKIVATFGVAPECASPAEIMPDARNAQLRFSQFLEIAGQQARNEPVVTPKHLKQFADAATYLEYLAGQGKLFDYADHRCFECRDLQADVCDGHSFGFERFAVNSEIGLARKIDFCNSATGAEYVLEHLMDAAAILASAHGPDQCAVDVEEDYTREGAPVIVRH